LGKTSHGIAILGSTGSIGTNTLDVVDRLGDEFQVTALAAGSNMSLLAAQVEKYRPALVSVAERRNVAELGRLLPRTRAKIHHGPEGAREVARADGAEIVVSAITGIDGFGPTLEAVRAGRRVALANKESMVVGGELLRKEAALSGASIIPVGSEHSGVFQCLNKERKRHVRRVILTASGGPFFRTPLKDIGKKTPEETLRHPRWVMGKKVTVDSATLMNKGLELIEARWLFDIEPGRLDVLIHPQSAVHSLVEMEDGSVLAQMSATDMRIPIQYALTWPGRRSSSLPGLDLVEVGRLEFFPVDDRRYPLFAIARRALLEGGSLVVALNAANEVAVGAFLERRILFSDIPAVVAKVMDAHRGRPAGSIEAIYDIDREARRQARLFFPQR
jgi:1-deoxy-D-xylulose-5-phosphate reductoisomerase